MKISYAILAIAISGCGAPDVEGGTGDEAPELDSVEQELIGATVTCSFPEIGRIGNCAATLVAPDMVITAAHCVGFEGFTAPGKTYEFYENYYFEINNFPGMSCGTPRSHRLKRVRSFTLGPLNDVTSDDDVAVLQLEVPVPSSVATPLNLRSSMPSPGVTVTAVGLGAKTANADGTCPDPDLKKAYTYYVINGSIVDNVRTVGSPYTGTACVGDSGGPVFVNKKLFWVISAGSVGVTTFGEVWRLAADIEWQMAHWTCPNGAVYSSGAAVSKNNRYPFARVCGMDRQNYECHHGIQNWVAKGGFCGSTSCQCAGGTALGGISIPAAQTSCGYTVCGMDHLVYECKQGSYWQAVSGSSCGYY